MKREEEKLKKVLYTEGEITKIYEEWCEIIANSQGLVELVTHLREHVINHYEKYIRYGEIGLNIWLIGVLNLANILEKKCQNIRKADRLFKLCTHHQHHGGPDPPSNFDIDKFMEEYKSEIKEFCMQKVTNYTRVSKN